MSTRARKGVGAKKAKMARQQSTRLEATPAPTLTIQRAETPPMGNEFSQAGGSQNGMTPGPNGGTPAPGIGMSHMDLDQTYKDDDDTADPEYQAWKTMTKKGRAQATV